LPFKHNLQRYISVMREKVDDPGKKKKKKRKKKKAEEEEEEPDDKALEDAFALMDLQKRGEMDFDEFKAGMALAGMKFSETEAREIFETADLDGGGTIDYEEFSEVMREKLDDEPGRNKKRKKKTSAEEADNTPDDKELEDAFALMDVQKRGEVDFDEFKAGMALAGMKFSEAEAREIFETADLDGGGTIDYEEFSEVMREKLDDGGEGAKGEDSVRVRGLEGFWEKERRGEGAGASAGAGAGAAAATRVMVKGECVGGGALDAAAGAMELAPDAAAAILARAVAAPRVEVTLVAVEKNTELMTLAPADLALVRGAPGGFEGWIAARVAPLASCPLFAGVSARRTDFRSLAAAAAERDFDPRWGLLSI
jgi:calmodulin